MRHAIRLVAAEMWLKCDVVRYVSGTTDLLDYGVGSSGQGGAGKDGRRLAIAQRNGGMCMQ
jgi:hypothetical protein